MNWGKKYVTPNVGTFTNVYRYFEGPRHLLFDIAAVEGPGVPTIAGDPGASKERWFSGGMILENG